MNHLTISLVHGLIDSACFVYITRETFLADTYFDLPYWSKYALPETRSRPRDNPLIPVEHVDQQDI